MDDYKISDNFQRTEGCKMISPHHSHPTNGVRPEDSNEAVVAIAGGDAFESAQDKYCVWIECCPEVYLAPVPQFTMSEVVNGINNFIQTP